MVTYRSTCTSCGDELIVTDPGQETHPDCPDSPTEDLQARFIDAVNTGDDEATEKLERALDMRPNPRQALLNTALSYAGHGWPVFPLRPGDKIPATRHGFKDATTDLDRIRRWWSNHPTSNIGLPTGHAFDVVDVDMPAGTWSWVELRDSEALGDIHGLVHTPRGLHAYVLPTGEGNSAGLMPGIDYRGRGGYVVAPPSKRHDGATYAWSMRPSPRLINAARGAVPGAA